MTEKSFTLRNYRAFADSAEIELRPLTLFFGYNSAGKSALLRWLPTLRDAVMSAGDEPLNLGSKALRGASFSDLVSKFTSSPAFEFSASYADRKIRYVIRNIEERHKQIVEELDVSLGKESISLKWLARFADESLYQVVTNGVARDAKVKFSGLYPSGVEGADLDVSGAGIVAGEFLRSWTENTYWLQANRAVPSRKEVFVGGGGVEPDGSGVTQLLYKEIADGSDMSEALSSWYKEATGYNFSVLKGAFSSSELFSFCLDAAGRPVELADTGEGMGQVLPIVGLLLLAERGRLGKSPTIVVEHPELHLHAAAEPALANLICRVAAKGHATVVAETHSESFLLALQLALIEGQLRPEDVLVYWVRQPEGLPASVNKIEFDSDGRPSGGAWPPGVFDEKTEQARKVVLARRAKQSNAS